jgi:protein SCO1/2
MLASVALATLLIVAPARATFNHTELGAISADPAAGARLPLGLHFTSDKDVLTTLGEALDDKPGVVIFADYTCHTLCGPILDFAAAGLEKAGLNPGPDYRVVVIGLDPKDTLDAARTMRAAHIPAGAALSKATIFLTGSADAIAIATAALGYHYRYDAEHDQFAHPAAVYVTDKKGLVTRVLSGIGLDGADLRLALVDAGRGAVGTLGDRIRLLCYGYDPTRGIYTERITLFLELAAAITLIALAIGLRTLQSMARRRASS